jgi:hypothetical protein
MWLDCSIDWRLFHMPGYPPDTVVLDALQTRGLIAQSARGKGDIDTCIVSTDMPCCVIWVCTWLVMSMSGSE